MPAIPPPLPIAAAHHSAHLQKLRAPMFRSSGPPSSTAIYENTPQTEDNALKPASTIISLLVDEEAKMQHILRDAQGRVSRVGDELRARLAQLKNADENLTAGPWLSIWGRQGIKTRGVQFEVMCSNLTTFALRIMDWGWLCTGTTRPRTDVLVFAALSRRGRECSTGTDRARSRPRTYLLPARSGRPALPTH
jgi:hypothetical protein